MSVKNQASIVAAIGATGSGKSAWVKQQLKKAKPGRILIWDPQEEYGEFGQVFTSRAELAAAVRAAGRAGKLAAVYRPGNVVSEYEAQFDWFCQLAYAWERCCILVEELADVTKPQKAPEGWSVLTRKGRHKGLRIIAASQRPAQVDKDFFGQATMIHCGRLNYAADVKCMADVLGVGAADISGMKPLDWVERDMGSGETRRGRLTF